MKKILLTAILAGGTLIGANAGNFTLNLPGFFLKITDGFRKERVVKHKPAPRFKKAEIRHHRKPAPPVHHAKKNDRGRKNDHGRKGHRR